MHEKCKLYCYTVRKFCGVEILTSHLHPTKQIITTPRAQANRVFPAEIRARSSHQRWPIHWNNRHLRRLELQSYWPGVATSCDATSNLCTCVQLQRRYDHYSCIQYVQYVSSPSDDGRIPLATVVVQPERKLTGDACEDSHLQRNFRAFEPQAASNKLTAWDFFREWGMKLWCAHLPIPSKLPMLSISQHF